MHRGAGPRVKSRAGPRAAPRSLRIHPATASPYLDPWWMRLVEGNLAPRPSACLAMRDQGFDLCGNIGVT